MAIQDQKNVMNLPTMKFDKEDATNWLDGEMKQMIEENHPSFVDFFAKINKPDGFELDMNEAKNGN